MRGWGRCSFESGSAQKSPYQEPGTEAKQIAGRGAFQVGTASTKSQRLTVLVAGAAKRTEGLEGGQGGRREGGPSKKGWIGPAGPQRPAWKLRL